MQQFLPFLCPLCKNSIRSPSSMCGDCFKSLYKLRSKNAENFIFLYKGTSRVLLHGLRGQKKSSINWLSKLCVRKIKSYLRKENILLESIHYLATIPSYSPFYAYHQPKGMEHIAHNLSSTFNIPYLELLFKKKKHSQHSKKSYERYDSKAFIYLNRKNISFHKKNILLLDDVHTSGTTSLQAIQLMGKESKVFQFYICKKFWEDEIKKTVR